MKCPRCGYYDPYWNSALNSRGHLEYAKIEDVPESKDWPRTKQPVLEKDGFAYWRSEKYAYRKPMELFRVEGKNPGALTRVGNYWDSINFKHIHGKRKRIGLNEKLDASLSAETGAK